jgi:hypothetical protein
MTVAGRSRFCQERPLADLTPEVSPGFGDAESNRCRRGTLAETTNNQLVWENRGICGGGRLPATSGEPMIFANGNAFFPTLSRELRPAKIE